MGDEDLIAAAKRHAEQAAAGASALGAALAFVFVGFILPSPSGVSTAGPLSVGIPVFLVYMVVTRVVGRVWGARLIERRLAWLRAGRVPDAREQRLALRLPLAQLVVPATFWTVAAVLFGGGSLFYSTELAGRVVITVLLGGLASCGISFLLVERRLRDVTARALASGAPVHPVAPGVVTRTVLAWALATAIPFLGVALVAGGVLKGDTPANKATAGSILFLAVLALVVGLVAMVVAARSVAEPVRSVRAALARVEAGDDSADVAVYDSGEVGLLQAGFNRMAAGLRERERLRELFTQHVGEAVVGEAMEHGVALGGQTREAAILFVDVIGSTRLASDRPADQVVGMLNEFFGVVVDIVARHGGWVNKFEGDAALCVFGVPTGGDDAAGDALAAGRTLARRLGEGPLAAAVGVSAGPVVAGNVGATRRLEYTVIGDPVNEASRLTELAKERPGRVLASEAARRRAGASEAARWQLGEEVVLRGRRAPTRLAEPVEGAPSTGGEG